MPDPRAQESYQIRFDWGAEGAATLSSADIRIWVDQSGSHPATADEMLVGDLDRAADLAAEVLRRQDDRGARVSVAVIAAGGGVRAPVDDLLAAGAVIEALAEAGLDHCSPEAAAAGSAFAGVRGGIRHLLDASVRSLLLRESPADV